MSMPSPHQDNLGSNRSFRSHHALYQPGMPQLVNPRPLASGTPSRKPPAFNPRLPFPRHLDRVPLRRHPSLPSPFSLWALAGKSGLLRRSNLQKTVSHQLQRAPFSQFPRQEIARARPPAVSKATPPRTETRFSRSSNTKVP